MGDQDRKILIRFFIGVAAVIVIIVLVWVIFFRHSGKKSVSQTTLDSASQSVTKQGNSTSGSAQKQSTGTSSTTTPSQSSSTTQTTPKTPSQPLANTGPGETAALFAVVTVAGTTLHYLYRRKAYQRIAVSRRY
jgi:cytoskeletal protein RodZ